MKNSFIRLCLFSVLIGLVCTLTPTRAQQISFNRLTSGEGLSDNEVTSLIQDKTGFLWFGTNDGLNRYDGYSFRIFRHNPGDSASISDDEIWSLHEDRSGRIWIGTKKGNLNRYDPESESFTHWYVPSKVVKENSITRIFEDSKGFIWVGTYKSGLYRFNPKNGKFQHWLGNPGDKKSLSNNYVTSIVEDHLGTLWISTYHGLNKFVENGGNPYFERYLHNPDDPQSLSTNIIWSLSKSTANPKLFWVGTAEGLHECDPVSGTFRRIAIANPDHLQFGTSAGTVIEVQKQSQRFLYIATYAGLLRMHEKTESITRFLNSDDDPKSIANNQINDILIDRSGVLWLATKNGVSYSSEKNHKFNNLPPPIHFTYDVLKKVNIQAIIQTKSMRVWYGTAQGLYYYDPGSSDKSVKAYPLPQELNIWSLAEGDKNELWIGTSGYGLYQLNTVTGRISQRKFNHPATNVASANFIKSLHYSGNSLYIGFWGIGLGRLNVSDGSFSLWMSGGADRPNSISHNDVWTISRDTKGRLWIGTNGGGLNLFDEATETFTRWSAAESGTGLLSNSINTLWEARSHLTGVTTLWVGTNKGLSKLTINETGTLKGEVNAEITTYTMKHGLPDNIIKNIVEDNSGVLWLTTGSGISRFHPKNRRITGFTQSDGLTGGGFNPAAMMIDRDGVVHAGSMKGLQVFSPNTITVSQYTPPLVLTSFQVFNLPVSVGGESPLKKSISRTETIELPYDQNVFSLEFAALDFNSSGSIQYRYKMEGFDADWITGGDRRFVTYTNLSPGKYVFKVQSTNADGVWQNSTTTLQIFIASPWWATVYAYTIYITVILAGLYFVRKFELNRTQLRSILKMKEYEALKQKELDETKSRFFANLSHEFRTPLMLIKGPAEILLQKYSDDNTRGQLQTIYRNSEQLQFLIDQLLELSQLESAVIPLQAKKSDLVVVLQGLLYSFEPLAAQKNITLSFVAHGTIPEAWIDQDKFEKIINNLVSNALKFTGESGSITVELGKDTFAGKHFAIIAVHDTGIGIPKDKLNSIFDRFYQVDDSIRRAYGGSGIGLSLVKELVDLHRWEITVTSEPDQGTEFRISIPLWDDYLDESQKAQDAREYQTQPGAAPDQIIPLSEVVSRDDKQESDEFGKTILIVEDSPEVRAYLTDILKDEFELYQCGNGKEGLLIAKEKIPDMIISDVMMPEMDGIEFCKQIKNDTLTSHIPVIMLTAKASGESRIEGLEIGADDYLTKPFNARELFARIRNLITQRQRLIEKFGREEKLEPKAVTSNPLDQEFLEKALKLASRNLDNPEYDTETFAAEMFLSRMQFHRKLKAITGQTPGDFLRILRLNHAAKLLQENRLSVTQIALEVGYSSPSQFSRAFTKQFHCSPSEFAAKQKP